MEAAAVFALVGLGYVVTRLTGKGPAEGFQAGLPGPGRAEHLARPMKIIGPTEPFHLQNPVVEFLLLSSHLRQDHIHRLEHDLEIQQEGMVPDIEEVVP